MRPRAVSVCCREYVIASGLLSHNVFPAGLRRAPYACRSGPAACCAAIVACASSAPYVGIGSSRLHVPRSPARGGGPLVHPARRVPQRPSARSAPRRRVPQHPPRVCSAATRAAASVARSVPRRRVPQPPLLWRSPFTRVVRLRIEPVRLRAASLREIERVCSRASAELVLGQKRLFLPCAQSCVRLRCLRLLPAA